MSGMISAPGGGVVQRKSVTALERAIAGQPEAVSQAITSNIEKLRAAMAIVAGARRVRLTGVGASGMAAEVGEHMLRAIGVHATATNAFDLATYTTGFEPGDAVIVISQRGTTRYPMETLRRAQQSGLKTIVITGQESPMDSADVVINTVPQEESGTPSASFTSAMAVVAAIAARFEPRSELASAVPTIPESVRSMLPSRQTASQVAEIAAESGRRTLIAGAGGLQPIARQGAFAAKIAAHTIVEGLHTEEAIHGGLLGINEGDLLVHIAPSGPAENRHTELAALARTVGVRCWKIGGHPDEHSEWHTPLPNVPEVITPIMAAIPLQWFALEIALARPVNPDSFRRDDPLFDRAYALMEL